MAFHGNAANLNVTTDVSAGNYGSGNAIPVINIDSSGRLNSINTSSVTYGTLNANANVGTIGSYAFMQQSSGNTQYAPGDTLAGSSLRYSDATGRVHNTTPSGNWRCMGYDSGAALTNSGSVGGGELSGTGKTFSGTSTSMTITANNDSTSEIGWQGETFTLELRLGSTLGDGDLFQSSTFSLYDDDLSVTVVGTSGTRVDIANNATTANVIASFSSVGDATVAGRIRNSSGTIVRSGFNFNNSGNTTITVAAGLPSGTGTTSATTANYTLEAYTGNSWLSTPFTIRRLAGDSSSSNDPLSNPTLSGSSSVTIESTEVSYGVNYSGMQSGEQIRMVDSSGAVSSSTTTAFYSLVTVTINNNLPSAGSNKTFTPQVKATGGNWTPKVGGNITITRQSGGSYNPPTPGGGGDFGNN